MAIFKKNNIQLTEPEDPKTPVKFSRREKIAAAKKAKKKWPKKAILTFVLILIFGGLGYFGFKGYNSVKNIFADNSGGILSLFDGSSHGTLKGENTGRVNVLLLGVGDEGHSGSTLSDTIMIASYDVKSKSVALFSIPRDLYVKIPGYGSTKINAAHAYGEEKNKKQGPQLAARTISETFDLPINYYVRVDFSGLKDVIDALGGVTVDVERSFCDYNYPVQYKGDTRKVCFTAGSQKMNGIKALQYARSRHALGPEGSDFARSKRQQNLMIAIKEKAASGGTLLNPKKVLDLMAALGNHVKTDFGLNEINRLIEIANGVDTSSIITKNFDNSPTGYLVSSSSPYAGYILSPRSGDWDEIQGVVKNIFAEAKVKQEAATIGVYNGTYTNGLATRVSNLLKGAGYNVVFAGEAGSRTVTKTQIIDMSDGSATGTVRALENRLGVAATKQSPDSTGYKVKIILGRDYR